MSPCQVASEIESVKCHSREAAEYESPARKCRVGKMERLSPARDGTRYRPCPGLRRSTQPTPDLRPGLSYSAAARLFRLRLRDLTVTAKPTRTSRPALLFRHLGDVHRKPRLRQQRRQLEYLEAVSGNFTLAIHTWLRIRRFVAALKIVEELLRLSGARLGALGAGHDRLSRIRPNQLRPVLLEQLSAGKEIGPDHLTVHRDHYTDCILVAQLADDALIVALHRLRYRVHLFLNFLVSHDARVGCSRVHLSCRSVDLHRFRHDMLRLTNFIPNLLLI